MMRTENASRSEGSKTASAQGSSPGLPDAPAIGDSGASFLHEITDSGTLPVGVEAQEMVSSVVCALLARLDLEEAREVLDSLQPDLQQTIGTCAIHNGSLGEAFNKHEFLARVAQHFQLVPSAVEPVARAVLGALRLRLPTRVASMVEGQLPHDLLVLWRAGRRSSNGGDAEAVAVLRANPISEPGGGGGGSDLSGAFQVDVRTRGFDLTDALRQYATDHVVSKLTKHGAHLQAVIIRLEDTNGSKGGIDMCCRVEVLIPKENALVVEETAGDLRAAMDLAADRIEKVVVRHIEHKRAGRSA